MLCQYSRPVMYAKQMVALATLVQHFLPHSPMPLLQIALNRNKVYDNEQSYVKDRFCLRYCSLTFFSPWTIQTAKKAVTSLI